MCPQLSGVYDSAEIQPLVKFKENLSVYSANVWNHFRVEYVEGLSAGPATIFEAVVASGATAIAANATIAAQVVAALQLNKDEFLHVRFMPLDNIECVIFEQAGQRKFSTANIHVRCDRRSKMTDPHHALTTFTVLGSNRDMNLEVRNPTQYTLPAARTVFWGFKYLLDPLDLKPFSTDIKKLLREGDPDTIKQAMGGPSVMIPAQGREV